MYLIGDAGYGVGRPPVMTQLRADIDRARGATPVVVFLGDNVYPAGVRDADHPGFAQDSTHLESQVDVLRGARARGIFIPGNHDWANSGAEGLRRMQNQTAFLRRRADAGVLVEMSPADGCPGPDVIDLEGAVRLIALDTHWWLHDRDERVNPVCGNRTEVEILADLDAALSELPDGRRAVVVAHHPLESFGRHGGYFSGRSVFFPLTDVVPWLYVPIPFIYTGVRNAGITAQDLPNARNSHMRRRLQEIFEQHRGEPLVYASGHEHTLQVLDGFGLGVGTHLVSGAGSDLQHVEDVPRAAFVSGSGHGERGFMKLEVFGDGSALVSVYTDGTRCVGSDCPPGPVLRYASIIR